MPLDLTSPSVPGPFYFAWITPTETTFDPFVHAREDEKILSFTVEQTEGDFATLSIEIRNPRIGLLRAGRRQHCYLSYAPGTSASPADVRPLFRGRLVGIPDNINGNIITLVFTARSDDFADRKEVLAYSLQELPYYDRVWVSLDAQSNPDSVLETRSALWHIDRVSGDVTISDLLSGEDGIAYFAATEVPRDSVQVHLNQTPLRRIEVVGTVGWQQASQGSVRVMYNNQFDSFLADTVAKDWPQLGANVGGGWEVTFANATTSIDNIPSDAFSSSITLSAPPDPTPADQTVIEPPEAPPRNKVGRPVPDDWIFIITHVEVHGKSSATEATLNVQEQGVIIPMVSIWLSMSVAYTAERNRNEQVSFIMEADTQGIITDAGDTERLILSLSGNDLGKDIGNGEIPIGDVQRRQYFPTERGLQSLEYLVLLARANLILRSRAVEITFACPFERAIDLSCRMSAQIEDNRLPGGIAQGKVIKYSFQCNGDSGEVIGSVTIGCAIGYGGTVSSADGDPSYVNDGYLNSGYQFYTNQVNVLVAGDVAYTVPGGPPVDDGLSFPLWRIPWLMKPQFYPVSLSAGDFPLNRSLIQAGVDVISPGIISDNEATQAAQKAIEQILKSKRCHLDFSIASVTGQDFTNGYNITTTTLQVPKHIDLEAESLA